MQKLKKGPALWLVYFILFAVSICMLFPFIWMVLSSFKTPVEILSMPPTFFPKDPTMENYEVLWQKFNFAKFFANSLFITAICVCAQLYTAALFGFVLGKYQFRGKNLIFMAVMFCMMVPTTINVIPLYQMMMWFKWINTYKSVIIPNLITLFGTFMMRQFSENIPKEMLEAARIDGASEFRIFHKICMPMFKNPLSALAILQFLWTWDSYLWPMLMLNDVNKYTITLGLGALNGQYGTPIEKMLAGASIAVIPVLIVYLIFQNRFIEGMAGASIKG